MASAAVDTVELLRRLVLQAPDGHCGEISAALRAMGYEGIGGARVIGSRLVVYLGGQEPEKPAVADALTAQFGGSVTVASTPVDRGWYEWSWNAPLAPA